MIRPVVRRQLVGKTKGTCISLSVFALGAASRPEGSASVLGLNDMRQLEGLILDRWEG